MVWCPFPSLQMGSPHAEMRSSLRYFSFLHYKLWKVCNVTLESYDLGTFGFDVFYLETPDPLITHLQSYPDGLCIVTKP